ncbi:hypothetical protein KEM63_12030 [Halopseudomonas nanhaiensis]|nr:hypothetical protein KEM63_12030 [Halopseudomonas nanhaiensis]
MPLILLSACSTSAPTTLSAEGRTERELLSHGIHIDAGESLVLDTPQRVIRVTEQKLYRVTHYDAQGNAVDQHDDFRNLPWAEKPVQVTAGEFTATLTTDMEGMTRLNLLDNGFIELDYDQLRAIQLSAEASPAVRSELNLLVGRDLRARLAEAVALIYDDLEEAGVHQWAFRVNRLAELGLMEESNQLENMLILLTTGDPELQAEFVNALEPASSH